VNILMLIQTGIFGLSGTMGMYAAGAAITAVLSYLVGSLNFCRFFGKKHECKSDLYELNEKAGLSGVAIPLLLDFLCGIVCATIGLFAMPGSGFACFAALFCILGHNFPIFHRFKSNGCAGGCAAFVGVMLIVDPLMALISFMLALLLYFVTRYSTAFVLLFTLVCPLLSERFPLWVFERGDGSIDFVYSINFFLSRPFTFVLMLVVLIFYGNAIGRMVRGKEEKLVFHSKKQKVSK